MATRPRRRDGHASATRRVLLAQEAARRVLDGGDASVQLARQRLARAHGLHDDSALPTLAEIEDELRTLQRLFGSRRQPAILQQLRREALAAMQALAEFHPRVTGAVLEGTAEQSTPIELQLFTDEPEAVLHFLNERGIPWSTGSRRLRFGPRDRRDCPLLTFASGEAGFRLTLIPLDLRHQQPIGDDGLPGARRASIADLQRLLDGAVTAPPERDD